MAGTDDELTFSADDLALGDLEDLETHWGLTYQQLMAAANGRQIESLGTKVLTAMGFLVLRQANPEATPEQARRMKLKDLTAAIQRSMGDKAPAKPQLAKGPGGEVRQDPQDGG